ncbi:MAP3K epsilon protein kinase 1-like [Nymphaea colorata]|nr:MAP3K epsilon protein kinase 1-like [Nymphaea colorata]
MSRQPTQAQFHNKSKTLNDKYMLGDEIGKGAYGRVYKGLDLENGNYVAIKQVSLENIPQEDLNIIMQEIDLLKNLNHKNIVKYLGSFKTKTHLYIILEYVENGSLASIVKPNKFGPFPESLVAVYIAQVLEGLVYLHEQGVIHRDIKGANILTTKEGLVKLADFGVATKLTEADVNTHSVVGTPYWMAPEVIEMSGVSAASDIWSVGCTAIELLTCVPPYYDLQPMPALFRIVQDDHPPIPDYLSPGITDFLLQCFRKDAMQRPDAKKLLMHPWIRNSRRALQSSLQRTGGMMRNIPQDVSTVVERSIGDGERSDESNSAGNQKVESSELESGDAANDVLSAEAAELVRPDMDNSASAEGVATPSENDLNPDHLEAKENLLLGQDPTLTFREESLKMTDPHKVLSSKEEHALHATDRLEPVLPNDDVLERISLNDEVNSQRWKRNDLVDASLVDGKSRESERNEGLIHQNRNFVGFDQSVQEYRSQQDVKPSVISGPVELSRFSDTPADSSLDDLFQEPLDRMPDDHLAEASTSAASAMLNQHNRNVPESGKTDLAKKLKATMVQKRRENEKGQKSGSDLMSLIMGIDGLVFDGKLSGENLFPIQAVEFSKLVGSLKPEEPEDVIVSACQKLILLFQDRPEQKHVFITQHGLLPLMELLEVPATRVICSVLQIINQLVKDNADFQENACLVGLIPHVMEFAVPDRPREVRMQAAYFLQQLCQSSALTLQMFIACRGIPVLVGFLEADYAKYREMVHLAIDGMWQVFKLQCSTPRNDFCRIAAKNGILLRLVNTLHSLNEAARLASISGGGETTGADGATSRPRSGPLDANNPPSVQCEPFDEHEPLKARIPLSEFSLAGTLESSKASVSHSQRPEQHSDLSLTSKPLESASQENHRFSTSKDALNSLAKDQLDMRKTEASKVEADSHRQQRVTNPSRLSVDKALKQLDRPSDGTAGSSNTHVSQNEQVTPLLSLLEKEPRSRHVSGQLEYFKHISGFERHENILPLLQAAAERKNGELDFLIAEFTEASARGRENGPPDSTPKATRKVGPLASGSSNTTEATVLASGLVSQTASGILSGSGVLNARPGSTTSSGLLSHMVSTLNADVAREYLQKVAELLFEFSRADTTVKSYMCSQGLLCRLFQMLNKIEPPILLKVLKCINNLSTDPNCLENLQRADAIKHLIPNLELHDGPLVSQIHTEVLNALYNLCKINKRRQEQAAENGIIPHLMRFIMSDSPLKQYALPLLCDMAHASRNSREQLRAHGGLDVYLSLLDDEVWSVTSLDSLAVCLAHDNDHKKVEQALLKKEAVQKLVKFFQCCPETSFIHILEPFLKIITKSPRINTTLAVNGLTPLLIARLDHQDAIARLNLLKLIKAVYEHHPRPKQLIVENDLPQKLQNLIEERRDGERSGGQVLVKQMATALLKALHINTVL